MLQYVGIEWMLNIQGYVLNFTVKIKNIINIIEGLYYICFNKNRWWWKL